METKISSLIGKIKHKYCIFFIIFTSNRLVLHELDMYSLCIQNVLKLIVEAYSFKHQNLIEATSSTLNYTKW